MGWFWEKWNSSKDSDPLRNLDPTLREFLEKESPVKYKPSTSPTPSATPASQVISTTQTTTPERPSPTQNVPKESLYPDGRYAYLWETYRPRAEIEAETKSDQEKLTDVLGAYKVRKVQIAQAAIENCSFEQQEIDLCFEHGSYERRIMMCRPETQIFDRCFVTQSRFLKALGYMSTFERTPEADEQIQMHADLLYHRMLDQETAIEAAKKAGQPIPTFPPMLAPPDDKKRQSFRSATVSTAIAAGDSLPAQPQTPAESQTPAEVNRAAVAVARGKALPALDPDIEQKLKPEAAMALRKQLKGLNEAEREVQQRSKIREIEDAKDTGMQMVQLREETKQRKKEAGERRGEWGNFIVKWFG